MKTSDALKLIKGAVEDVETKGQTVVATVNLKQLLDQMINDAQKEEAGVVVKTAEQIGHELEVWKARTAATTSLGAEMLKATTEAGQTALKSAILINGGAAVAILAFVGNAVTRWKIDPGSPLLTAVGFAMLTFVIGTGLAGASTAFRYLSQFAYGTAFDNSSKRWRTWGDLGSLVAVLLGVGSFVAFFIGGYQAFRAIVQA
ncbi:hypothetical protein [Paraburkholderia diazotrophica]|uniref:Uncharacterized protein n=1 Tax=Paraburkholderia diazotrophica TaxID=667676 RepID=A0A1H6TRQ1_9BURK|nr:hypothetical protein [Paraburkholderia diazotrophica]SEI80884.1 hypothetical protein SAMN05192539_1004177 [Paraburkholderia diazotrophica]